MSRLVFRTDFEESKKINIPSNDIIVTRVSEKEEYDKDGNKIIKRIEEPINISKRLRETVLTLKEETINEKIAKIKAMQIGE